MKDDLGKRMKEQYEVRTRTFLPRRTYTIIRIDGKAFHTYTRGLGRPYDKGLADDMDATTEYLCHNIQGCIMGYVQSDEISLLLTDFEKENTCACFDGQVQKIVSVAASMATSKFNQLRIIRWFKENGLSGKGIAIDIDNMNMAEFDARVFSIPDPIEVENYFVWRQKDAVRNSISMQAQSLYSHKQLEGKSSNEQQEMCFQKGVNWNDIEDRFKRGQSFFIKEIDTMSADSFDQTVYTQKIWVKDPFDFLKDRIKLNEIIPKYNK